ncbi:MAG: DUF2189 domain-containing protein [Gammaproteobacteria bacterium]|nr:DUF2189 domain-containing protein [Gammaproteobacteria bacterium]
MSTDVVDRYAHERGFHWPRLRELGLSAPLHWLDRGFHDMLAAPVASLFYGAMLATMGYLLTHFYGGAVGLALTTGFLLIGPFLAVGLYDISRQVEFGQGVRLAPTLTAWRDNLPAIGFYALILMLSLAVWMRVSVVLIALFIPTGVESLHDLMAALLRTPDAWVFAFIYVTVGAVLAAFSFASSAVALPLLRDHPGADAISAMIVSFQVIRRNPKPLLLWAAVIVAATAAGFITWFVGLVVTVPLIGHATWHAYREALDFGAPQQAQ